MGTDRDKCIKETPGLRVGGQHLTHQVLIVGLHTQSTEYHGGQDLGEGTWRVFWGTPAMCDGIGEDPLDKTF